LVHSLQDGVRATAAPLALCVALAAAAGHAASPELQVNTYTQDGQYDPAVAMDADGNFVITWTSGLQDGHVRGIYGQRFDALGNRVGGEFQVNTYTTNHQEEPSVAMAPDGAFVVVWASSGQDGSDYGVYGQRFDALGNRAGEEFQVNTYTESGQSDPSVTMDAEGNFVVIWHSYRQDGSEFGVYGQRFDAAGSHLGGEFQVNAFTSSRQAFPSVAMDADGDFVVVWQSMAQDGSAYAVVARRYNASGVTQGGEFVVNTYTANSQVGPSVAMDTDGNFVVVWQSDGQDGDSGGVYGQRFDALGNRVGSEFQVNTYTTNWQGHPSVAMDPDGDVVVAWDSWGQDGDSRGVYGQRFDALGNPVGTELQVNTCTTQDQGDPSVAMHPGGDFVVAWASSGQDGDREGVYARLLPINLRVLTASVQLEGYTGSPGAILTLRFVLSDADEVPLDTREVDVAFTNGSDTEVVVLTDVPADTAWVSCKEVQHFLRRRVAVGGAAPALTADFTGANQLLGGDLNDDNFVELRDFAQFLRDFGKPDCPESDINGDGDVDNTEFGYIGLHFFQTGDPE